MDGVTLYVLGVVLLATLIRSTFGFGEALVAVPLLALRIPIGVAAPLAVLLSVVVAGIIVVQDWRKIHLRSASGLILFTLPGLPLGLWLLKVGNQDLIKAILGFIIVAFSIYSLIRPARGREHGGGRVWLAVCGFCAGVLGGAYGLNGPPLVIYGAMRRWSAQHFRATLQAYFLPASLITLIGFWLAGMWTPPLTRYFLLSLPLTLAAIVLGRFLNHRLRGDAFLRYVYVGLICTGLLLAIQAIG
jgi:uncharacterized membrane protein YfcA